MERTVDIYVHEQDMSRMERSNARSHFLCLPLTSNLRFDIGELFKGISPFLNAYGFPP